MSGTAYPIDNLSDEELLRRMAAGDSEAFETLYDRRQGAVYRYALRMCGCPSTAEDITQEVFVALIRDSQQYNPARGHLASYLYGIARHRILRRLEKERPFVTLEEDEKAEPQEPTEPHLLAASDPLTELSRQETIDAVRRAILSMPAHYRDVVVLCSLQEVNYEEAAVIIGCPVGTVRSRLSRARLMLIEKLRAVKEPGSLPEPAFCGKGQV